LTWTSDLPETALRLSLMPLSNEEVTALRVAYERIMTGA